MVETMTAYENYEYNMNLIEEMFRHIATEGFRQNGVHRARAHD
jgi:lysyl-tRNA synthetase class II